MYCSMRLSLRNVTSWTILLSMLFLFENNKTTRGSGLNTSFPDGTETDTSTETDLDVVLCSEDTINYVDLEVQMFSNAVPGTSLYTLSAEVTKSKGKRYSFPSNSIHMTQEKEYFNITDRTVRTAVGYLLWDVEVAACLAADYTEILQFSCPGCNKYIGPKNISVTVKPTKPEIIEVDSVYVNNITSNSSEKLHVHMVTFRNDGPYVSFSCNCSVNGQNDSSLFWFEEGTIIYTTVGEIDVSQTYELTIKCVERGIFTVEDRLISKHILRAMFSRINESGTTLKEQLTSSQITLISAVAGLLAAVTVMVIGYLLARKLCFAPSVPISERPVRAVDSDHQQETTT